ncbi:transcriptional regulator, TetR family [Desulfonauticus submarinus]|uniref:Transcriptional regulator, TetR family n=1 Tax=Desulfonauticus submarinus TaxID=206665 RepID=A0A1G9ZLZ0_9BACT|nr:TetR/AcrR family transcriptional regulator [Desulfonauticus submarinus]SDN22220.1 transcriptional regulator, TetR family [Desulfonauticus submarinus]
MNKVESTRDKIITAAYNCFSEKGYLGTSTKEIAKVAGVSEITLFRHFGKKEGIFEAVIRNYSILSELQKISFRIEGASLYDTLKIIAERLYFTLKDRKKFIKIVFSEINRYSDKIREIYKNFIEELDNLIVDILVKYHKKSISKDIDIKIAVKGFIGMVFCYFQTNEIFLCEEVSFEDIDIALSTFVNIFLKALKNM